MARLVMQGLTEDNHLDAVAHLLSLENATLIVLSIAFVRASGVAAVTAGLAPISDRVKIFAGIRNGVTSAQGIRALADVGVEVYVVDTGSAHRLYHPKVYFSRSSSHARLLVGSANLTAGGLNSNVEASLLLELDYGVAHDGELCSTVERAFDQLESAYPDNVMRLDNNTSLDNLLADGRYEDERISAGPAVTSRSGVSVPVTPLMPLHRKHSFNDPRSSSGSPNAESKTTRVTEASSQPAQKIAAEPASHVDAARNVVEYLRVWRTEELTMRDLGVSPRPGTHAPGSMNLDKGDLTGPYEWASYFRDVVFDDLEWSTPNKANISQANALFRIVIEGIDCGEFDLTVRHDNKIGTPSYRQQNAMTRLSWNDAKEVISRRELVGRSLTLSKDVNHTRRFLIEID